MSEHKVNVQPWNGSENYSVVTICIKGKVIATAILYNHGSDVANFVKVIRENIK